MVSETYPRNLVGYGRHTPDPKWPGDARVAVQFVINYEEGGESSILDGDPASENLLSEIVGAAAWPNQRTDNAPIAPSWWKSEWFQTWLRLVGH